MWWARVSSGAQSKAFHRVLSLSASLIEKVYLPAPSSGRVSKVILNAFWNRFGRRAAKSEDSVTMRTWLPVN
jgi:hypothetical protein